MKKTIEIGFLAAALYALSGCAQLDRAADYAYEPVVTTNAISGVQTNYVVRENLTRGINLAGDLVPVPWGGLASNALIALLGIGAAARGRQWKRAAVSGVSAAQAFKAGLKELDTVRADKVKGAVITEQRTAGTQSLIQKILNQI